VPVSDDPLVTGYNDGAHVKSTCTQEGVDPRVDTGSNLGRRIVIAWLRGCCPMRIA